MEEYDICIIAVKQDGPVAERLADSIRHYKLPAGIIPADPAAGYQRILVDAGEEPFDENRKAVLEHSRYLIVMCSPDTKDNPAIDDRLSYYRKIRQGEHIIAVIVRGEPADSFPEGFIEKKKVQHILPDMTVSERIETIEPIAADLRANTPKRQKQLLRYETVRITASVLEMHPDLLEQRHRSRQRRRILAAVSAAAVVCLFATGIFIRLGYIAKKEGDIAAKQTDLSIQIAQRTIDGLPERFADDPQAQSYVDAAVENAKSTLEGLENGKIKGASSEEEGGGS